MAVDLLIGELIYQQPGAIAMSIRWANFRRDTTGWP